jgi:MFS family permease
MRRKAGILAHLSRTARLLIIAAGILSISFFGIQMLLQVLYVLRLGHGPEYVGLFSAAGAFTFMSMGIPSGALGSRFGTSRVMIVGGIGAVFGMVLLPLSEYVPSWAQYSWPIVSQIVMTVGWSMFTVNSVPALMAATTAGNRNSAYALNGVLGGLGTLAGTLLGGMLPGLFSGVLGQTMDGPGPYRLSLWLGAALALAALVPLWFIEPVKRIAPQQQAPVRGKFPLLPIALTIGYVYLRHAGWATCQAFCNAYMDTDLRLSTASIGMITGVGQLVATLAPLINPRLATRYSNGWTLLMTTLGTAVCLLPLALIPNWAAAGFGRASIQVLSAMWLPALQVFQMEMVDSEWRSLAYGAISMAMGMGFGTTSLAGGYIIAAWGYSRLFLIGVGLSAIAGAFMWGMLRYHGMRAAAPAATVAGPAEG